MDIELYIEDSLELRMLKWDWREEGAKFPLWDRELSSLVSASIVNNVHEQRFFY